MSLPMTDKNLYMVGHDSQYVMIQSSFTHSRTHNRAGTNAVAQPPEDGWSSICSLAASRWEGDLLDDDGIRDRTTRVDFLLSILQRVRSVVSASTAERVLSCRRGSGLDGKN